MEALLSLEPVLELTGTLARDLQGDYLPLLPRVLSALADLVDEGESCCVCLFGRVWGGVWGEFDGAAQPAAEAAAVWQSRRPACCARGCGAWGMAHREALAFPCLSACQHRSLPAPLPAGLDREPEQLQHLFACLSLICKHLCKLLASEAQLLALLKVGGWAPGVGLGSRLGSLGWASSMARGVEVHECACADFAQNSGLMPGAANHRLHMCRPASGCGTTARSTCAPCLPSPWDSCSGVPAGRILLCCCGGSAGATALTLLCVCCRAAGQSINPTARLRCRHPLAGKPPAPPSAWASRLRSQKQSPAPQTSGYTLRAPC